MGGKRRDFLKRSGILGGYFVLHASVLVFPSKTQAVQADSDPLNPSFPWGVASADPQPNAVLLWTKIHSSQVNQAEVKLTLQVSLNDDFNGLVLEKSLLAAREDDFTVRALVKGLAADTTYFYRFIAIDNSVSRTGRTWTAPDVNASTPVTIAFISCSSWPWSKFGALRHLINSEKQGGQRSIDLILHLGDYVYGLPEEAGEPLILPPEAQAATEGSEAGFAIALAAHRRIYRGYLKDPDMQDARALYPFVSIWDDHEYANDAWQSYIADSGANPEKRLAATQAWFEYVPQILSDSAGIKGVPNEAYDLRPTTVEKAHMRDFDTGFMSLEPNNLRAINAIRCYRTVRWGATVDLILTDNRSYRGPSANPAFSVESIANDTGMTRIHSGFELFEGDALNVMAQGKTYQDGKPPGSVVINGRKIPNPRLNAPAVSMLGVEQKDWFKRSLQNSDAVWKIWGNSVPIMGFRFDANKVNAKAGSGYLWTDAWDGFPNEREELMRFIRKNGIANIVSLSGDRHAQYAGLVAENYEAENPRYVIPDFTCTAVSAPVRAPIVARTLARFRLQHLAYLRRKTKDGQSARASNLNVFMRMGAQAANVMAASGDLAQARAVANPTLNPHLDYADNDVHGYGIARFHPAYMEVDFISVAKPEWDAEKHPDGPPLLRVVAYRVNKWQGGDGPKLQRLYTRGEAVFGES